MRAPLSKLAKELLDNPDSAKQLKEWLGSGRKNGIITVLDSDGEVRHITAHRLNTTVDTHGQEPTKKQSKVKDVLAELIDLLVNPFS